LSAAFSIRPAELSDRESVLALLRASLGRADDARFADLFAWKHDRNPFAASPAWVAVADDRVIGLRVFMRWEFAGPNGEVARAGRAVDTATDPAWQGKGVFKALTLHGLDELQREGVDFIFNTPNANSLPGYLKMGWLDQGRLPAVCRPRSALAVGRMAHSRQPAEHWSIDSPGTSATTAFADPDAVSALLGRIDRDGWRTRLSVQYLQWRYGLELLQYRVALAGETLADGIGIYRVRRRGAAREAVVAELLLPNDNATAAGRLVQRVLRQSRADYALLLDDGARPARTITLPGQGPTLTWRTVNATAPPTPWHLVLGDIELF
jgi:GNAT superfamily N-acetyltransferase